MAAEPWIDHTDPAYWQELIANDLALAKNLVQKGRLFMSGFKCSEAAEKIMSCWFVTHRPPYELPKAGTLEAFAEQTGFSELLTLDEQMLLAALDACRAASQSPAEKAAYGAALTQESCSKTLAGTEALYEKVRALALGSV